MSDPKEIWSARRNVKIALKQKEIDDRHKEVLDMDSFDTIVYNILCFSPVAAFN